MDHRSNIHSGAAAMRHATPPAMELLQQLIEEMAQKQPDDPLQFMSAFFHDAAGVEEPADIRAGSETAGVMAQLQSERRRKQELADHVTALEHTLHALEFEHSVMARKAQAAGSR